MALEIERKLLTKIAKQHGGVLLVDDVLSEARDEDSPLHKHFEWDNTVAAEAHRRQQARVLIQRCKITIADAENTTVRAFLSLQSDRDSGGGYRLTSTIMSDEMMKQELLHDIRMTITRWTRQLHLLDQDLAEALLQIEDRVRAPVQKENRRRPYGG